MKTLKEIILENIQEGYNEYIKTSQNTNIVKNAKMPSTWKGKIKFSNQVEQAAWIGEMKKLDGNFIKHAVL